MAATMEARSVAASLGACALLLAAACGGSSSETPPPLEPDPEGFHYVGAKPPRPSDEAAEAPEKEDEEPEEAEPTPAKKRTRGGQAPSTWGQSESGPPQTSKQPELK